MSPNNLFDTDESPKAKAKAKATAKPKAKAETVDVTTTDAVPTDAESSPSTQEAPVTQETVVVAPKVKPAKSDSPSYSEGVKPTKDSIKGDKDMREYLMSFPKVMVMIPRLPGEKEGSTEPVIINGIRLDVPKGTMIEIPKPFADVVFSHFNIGQIENLGSRHRIDGNAWKVAALN